MIDLRSDTVTKPTKGMLDAMLNAELGDDVFGEDPTVVELEKKLADLFGMEAGLFCPSGTMCNQIAIKCHVQPGDQVICDQLSHIYIYEGGGIALNSGASVRLLDGNNGIFSAEQVQENINPDDIHLPISRLVSIENTCNKGGGSVWSLSQIQGVSALCQKQNLKLHLDGARIFNALTASDYESTDVGELFDSISICLSKGLGAPVGSVLLGDFDFIHKSRRVRKVFGGGMRQVGNLAAAGIYAIENNIDRLKEDHKKAKAIGVELKSKDYIKKVFEIQTNIVLAEINNGFDIDVLIEGFKGKGVLAIKMSDRLLRFVTHLDFSDDDLGRVLGIL